MDIWFRGIGCEFENKGFGLGIFYYPDIKTVSIELLLWAIYISKVPEGIKKALRDAGSGDLPERNVNMNE